MSVPNQENPQTEAVGNGVATVFAFDFLCLLSQDLRVSIDGALVDPSLYAVGGLGDMQGGAVTFIEPPADGAAILMELAVVPERNNNYQDNGDLFADTVNFDFDRLWLALQQAFSWLGRAIQLPVEFPRRNSVAPAVSIRARKALIFDDDGNVTVGKDDYEDQAENAAESARQAAESANEAGEARDEAVRIATELGDLESAVDRAETAADSAEADAASASADADRAEAAADAATLAAGVYPDTNTIINGGDGYPPVAEGHFATTPSTREYGFLDLYKVVGGAAQYVNTYPDRDAVILAISAIGIATSVRWRCFYEAPGDRGLPVVVDMIGAVIGGTEYNYQQSTYGPSRRCFFQWRGDKGGPDVVDKFGVITSGGNALQALIVAGLARCFFTERGAPFESIEVDKFGTITGGPTVIEQIGNGGGTAVVSGLYIRKLNATQLSLYFKGSNGTSWVETVLERVIVPYNGSTNRTNADLWRLINAYKTDRFFVRQYEGNVIINNGEIECAIGVQGAPDHVGGYHGFERQNLYYLLIDGVRADIDAWTGEGNVRAVDFIQSSDIYLHGTLDNVLAKHLKHYQFVPTGFLLGQRLEFMQSVQLSTAYLGMLPIKRRAIDDTTGPRITEYARRSPILSALDPASPIAPYAIEDIREIGATQYETKDTESITIWGEESGISVTIDIKDMTRLPSHQVHIQTDRPQYNKIYIAPGTNALVAAGDVWYSELQFTFNTVN